MSKWIKLCISNWNLKNHPSLPIAHIVEKYWKNSCTLFISLKKICELCWKRKKFKKNYGYKCKKLPHLLNKTYSLPKESDLSLTKVAILRQLTKYCIYQSTSKWFLMPKLFQTWKRFYIKVFGIEQKITSLSNIPYSTY